jgi:hypothetical protein
MSERRSVGRPRALGISLKSRVSRYLKLSMRGAMIARPGTIGRNFARLASRRSMDLVARPLGHVWCFLFAISRYHDDATYCTILPERSEHALLRYALPRLVFCGELSEDSVHLSLIKVSVSVAMQTGCRRMFPGRVLVLLMWA